MQKQLPPTSYYDDDGNMRELDDDGFLPPSLDRSSEKPQIDVDYLDDDDTEQDSTIESVFVTLQLVALAGTDKLYT